MPPPSPPPQSPPPPPDHCKEYGKCVLPHDFWAKHAELFYATVPELCDTFFCQSEDFNPIFWMNHEPDTSWIGLASIYYSTIANFYYSLTNQCCGEEQERQCTESEYYPPNVLECVHFSEQVLGTPFEKCVDAEGSDKTTSIPTDDKTPTTTKEDPTGLPPCTEKPEFDPKIVDPKTVEECTKVLTDFCGGHAEVPECKYGGLEGIGPTQLATEAKQTGAAFAAVSVLFLVLLLFFSPVRVL